MGGRSAGGRSGPGSCAAGGSDCAGGTGGCRSGCGSARCSSQHGAGQRLCRRGAQTADARVPLQEVHQERQRAVELDALGRVCVHAGLDGLPGVVQAAFDGALRGLQGGGNVLYAHLLVVEHQHALALGRRQLIHQLHDHPPGLIIVQRFVRHGLLVQAFEGIQQAVALVVLRDLGLPSAPGEDIAAVVGGHGGEPAPEGLRVLEPVQPGQHGDQDLLGGVQGVLLVFQHLPAVVVHPVLGRQDQFLLGLLVPGQTPPDHRRHARHRHAPAPFSLKNAPDTRFSNDFALILCRRSGPVNGRGSRRPEKTQTPAWPAPWRRLSAEPLGGGGIRAGCAGPAVKRTQAM